MGKKEKEVKVTDLSNSSILELWETFVAIAFWITIILVVVCLLMYRYY